MVEVNPGEVAMPGDVIRITPDNTKQKIVIGPGLRSEGETIYACKAGILKKRAPSIYYIDNYQRRYVPARGENVLGIITQKAGDIYRVDIGASEPASLSYLAFEGASKRNRPDVHLGDIVFAKLVVASKNMESELVCVDSQGKKGKLGVVGPNGFLFNCSLNLSRKLLNPENSFFADCGKEYAYEIAVGMNGRIWVNAKYFSANIAISNVILLAETASADEIKSLRESIAEALLRAG